MTGDRFWRCGRWRLRRPARISSAGGQTGFARFGLQPLGVVSNAALAADELWRSFLQERGDALAEVVRLRRRGLELRLALELLVEGRYRRRVEQPLRHPDPARRERRELRCELGGAGGQRARFDDLGDETPGVRLRRGQLPAGAIPLECEGRDEQPGDEVRAA